MISWKLILVATLMSSDGASSPVSETAQPATANTVQPAVAPVVKTTWHTNYEEAQKEAKQTGLPLVVHFYADWCGPCQSMEQAVLNSPDLKQHFGKSIVGVKINSDQQAALTQQLRVTALPTDVYLDPNGRELGRSVGSRGKSEYITAVTTLRTKVEVRPALKTQEIQVATLTAKPAAASQPAPAPAQPASVTLPNAAPESSNIRVLHQVERDHGYIVGLNGQSPVSFVRDGVWKAGSSEFAVTYRGISYRLSDADEVAEFQSAPERYVPSLHGCDPVVFQSERKLSSGATQWSSMHDGRLYFFVSSASRDRFQAEPARFASAQTIQFFRQQTRDEVTLR